MKKVLLVSHGGLASGMKEAVEIVLGEQKNLMAINAFGTYGEPDEKISSYLETISDEDELIVLSDIAFGSVSQKIATMSDANTKLISGMNLPLVLTIMLNDQSQISEAIEEARGSIVNVREAFDGVSEDLDE